MGLKLNMELDDGAGNVNEDVAGVLRIDGGDVWPKSSKTEGDDCGGVKRLVVVEDQKGQEDDELNAEDEVPKPVSVKVGFLEQLLMKDSKGLTVW